MKIYYQPENLWKGRKAITRLRKATKLPLKQVKDWLAKQALWQVHICRLLSALITLIST